MAFKRSRVRPPHPPPLENASKPNEKANKMALIAVLLSNFIRVKSTPKVPKIVTDIDTILTPNIESPSLLMAVD
jgi:hypothetical protein